VVLRLVGCRARSINCRYSGEREKTTVETTTNIACSPCPCFPSKLQTGNAQSFPVRHPNHHSPCLRHSPVRNEPQPCPCPCRPHRISQVRLPGSQEKMCEVQVNDRCSRSPLPLGIREECPVFSA